MTKRGGSNRDRAAATAAAKCCVCQTSVSQTLLGSTVRKLTSLV